MGTVEKSTDLLFALSAGGTSRTVTSLAGEMGWPKASTHRLLRSLMHRRLVDQDGAGLYCLGAGIVTLGLSASHGEPLIRACQPALAEYSQQLGETLYLVTARAGELVVSHKVEGRSFLRASPSVGSRLPPHATAAGRVFLAFAPAQLSVPKALQPFTRLTPRGDKLKSAVERERQQGYAVSLEEWCEGLSAVAAPILVSGRLLGSVGMACTSARFHQMGVSTAVKAVLAAAQQAARGCAA